MEDLGGLMKQAQKQLKDMQRRMREVEEDLRERAVEGSAGGGMVKVIFNGLREPVDVKIEPVVLEEESPEFLQEMILAAMRQGLKKSQELEEAERGKVSGKLNIPGLGALF
ncbi:MAG: YbaB/EbfC family nucleoid-associated protein [Candidatus Brocadiae bacterium]|nr:YbaB/EbfC family nucleoid-associated protein [Candidatus Brocadiia bacterium]